MNPTILLHCPEPTCGAMTIHSCRPGQPCKHDIGLDMIQHVGTNHPEMVFTAAEFMNKMERHRLNEFVRMSLN